MPASTAQAIHPGSHRRVRVISHQWHPAISPLHLWVRERLLPALSGTELLPHYDRCNHGERNQTTASLYIQRAELGTAPVSVSSPLKVMAHSMRQKRTDFPRANPWPLVVLLALVRRSARPSPPLRPSNPSSVRVFRHKARLPLANPAESSAYSAAISQSDPDARVSAIQQFLIQYPNSSLRQPAIAQMMLAKREAHAPGGTTPAPAPMNRPMTPTGRDRQPRARAPAAAPVAAPQPVGPPRDSLLQHPAKPAQVTVTHGQPDDQSRQLLTLPNPARDLHLHRNESGGAMVRMIASSAIMAPATRAKSCSPCLKVSATTS